MGFTLLEECVLEYPPGGPMKRNDLRHDLLAREYGRPMAICVGPGEGATIQGPVGGPLTFKVRGEQTSGRLTVLENTPRCFQNVGERAARILVIFSPSGMERFFDAVAGLDDGPLDPGAFQQIGADVGMTVVGPPLARSHPL